jgi:predicted RNase H-related nuclease YkuK (DUF458 family)
MENPILKSKKETTKHIAYVLIKKVGNPKWVMFRVDEKTTIDDLKKELSKTEETNNILLEHVGILNRDIFEILGVRISDILHYNLMFRSGDAFMYGTCEKGKETELLEKIKNEIETTRIAIDKVLNVKLK